MVLQQQQSEALRKALQNLSVEELRELKAYKDSGDREGVGRLVRKAMAGPAAVESETTSPVMRFFRGVGALAGGAVKGALQGPPAVLSAIGLAGEKIGQVTGLGDDSLTDNALFQAGQMASAGIEAAVPIPRDFQGGKLEKIGGALGSGLSSAGVGMGGRMLGRAAVRAGAKEALATAASYAPTVAYSAALNATGQFLAAKQAGASDDRAFTAYLLGAGLQGPMEVLGVEAAMIGRLGKALAIADAAHGGAIRRALSTVGMEGVQGLFQGATGEAIAKAVYDADRGAIEMLGNAIESGALEAVGALPGVAILEVAHRAGQAEALKKKAAAEQEAAQARAAQEAEAEKQRISRSFDERRDRYENETRLAKQIAAAEHGLKQAEDEMNRSNVFAREAYAKIISEEALAQNVAEAEQGLGRVAQPELGVRGMYQGEDFAARQQNIVQAILEQKAGGPRGDSEAERVLRAKTEARRRFPEVFEPQVGDVVDFGAGQEGELVEIIGTGRQRKAVVTLELHGAGQSQIVDVDPGATLYGGVPSVTVPIELVTPRFRPNRAAQFKKQKVELFPANTEFQQSQPLSHLHEVAAMANRAVEASSAKLVQRRHELENLLSNKRLMEMEAARPFLKAYVAAPPQTAQVAPESTQTAQAAQPGQEAQTTAAPILGGRQQAKAAAIEVSRRVYDSLVDVRTAIKERAGDAVPDSENFYEAETLVRSAAQQQTSEQMRPVLDAFHAATSSGVDYDLISDLGYLEHAPERDASIAALGGPALGSGLSLERRAEIQAKVDALTPDQRNAAQTALAALRSAVAESEQRKITEGQYPDDRNKAWKFYLPLKTDVENDMLPASLRAAAFGRRGHRALGRQSEADDPVLFAALKIAQNNLLTERSKAERAVLSFVQAHPDQKFATIGPPLKPTIVSQDGQDRIVKRRDMSVFADPATIVVPVQGQFVPITFHGEAARVAIGFKGLNVPKLGEVMRVWAKATRGMGKMLTQWNPVWMPVGWAYNAQDVAFLGRQYGFSLGKVLWQSTRNIGRLQRAHADIAKADPGTAEYLRSGAPISTLGFHSLEDAWKQMSASMRRGSRGRAIPEVFEYIRQLNLATENASRLALYEHLRGKGVTQQRAAFIAKEAMNFERKGEWNTHLNAMFMFSNAILRGQAVAATALKNVRVRRALYGAAATLATIDVLNAVLAGEDENGENRWDKIDDNIKARGLVLMSPSGDGSYITIPGTQLFSPFLYAGTLAGEMLRGRTAPVEAAGKAAIAFVNWLSPIGQITPKNGALGIAQALTPDVAGPVVDVAVNSRGGRPIIPQRHDETKPDAERFYPKDTNKELVWLAQALNRLTDTDDSGRGDIDVSPGNIQYLIERYTGGVGMLLGQVARLASGAVDTRNVPLLSRFYREENPFYTRSLFYSNAERIDQAMARYKQLASIESEEGEKRAEAWQAGHERLMQLKNRTDAARAQVNAMRKANETDEAINAVMAEFNRDVRNTLGGEK